MKTLLSNRFGLGAQDVLPGLQPDQLKYIDEVKSKINKEFTLVPISCPCQKSGAKNDVVISEIDRYGLPLQSVLCNDCGTVRIDPYLDRDSLSDFYTNYYQQMYGRSVDVGPYFEKQKNYGKKFYALTQLPLGSNILEFGCGAGGALDIFRAHGHNVYGIEYSQKLIDYGKSKGLSKLFYGSLQEFQEKNQQIKFDLIYSNHVFEHISDPINYLTTCIKMLSSKGAIICSVPDLYNSHQYIFPNSNLKLMFHIAHIYNYSFQCLERMATQLGMKIERLFPNPDIRTATSDMPEIWFKISKEPAGNSQRSTANNTNDYLGYLQHTEQNFNTGTGLLKTEESTGRKFKTFVKKIVKWRK